ncbi:MAG: LytTR family DNA-binding domain-containing protein [Lachnospiraceae bacterium]|nr:LytTR family DNA-binding domain-containing protein [Lachnospiraceae bacterium]
MQIAVCDDEKEIRELYAAKIRQLYPYADVVQYQSGEELLAAHQKPDILLLDIQMPGRNGMETAEQLRRSSKEMVIIFVSALEEYVFQAFDVGAFHYLVKPFDDEKFAKVLARAVAQYEDSRKQENHKDREKEMPSLVITRGGEHITVRIADIVYAEVFDRKVILHTMDSDVEYYGKMKELMAKVGDDFYRPHRAYLVNFNYIRKYDATTIYLRRGQALMARQNYHDFVKSYLRFNQKEAVYADGRGRME